MNIKSRRALIVISGVLLVMVVVAATLYALPTIAPRGRRPPGSATVRRLTPIST